MTDVLVNRAALEALLADYRAEAGTVREECLWDEQQKDSAQTQTEALIAALDVRSVS